MYVVRPSTTARPTPSSTKPRIIGENGWDNAPTVAGGARWCNARPSPSNCSPLNPLVPSLPPPLWALPEHIGGKLNWDYRYTWVRDASFTCYALLRLGFDSEARRFISWLEDRASELGDDDGLQVMYTIDGRPAPEEQPLKHLSGYQNSHPVLLGNNARDQLQLDIYGELMDAVYLANKYDEPISYNLWAAMRKLLGWLCKNWQQPDEGVWEIREKRQEYVHSRMMVWVALDRGVRVARQRGLPADTDLWEKDTQQGVRGDYR